MLSYFGTDQSQVQRYLTARNVDEARTSLLISAYWKIPLQALILLIGVLVFVFYTFKAPPMLFNPAQDRRVATAAPAEYADIRSRYAQALGAREQSARALAAAHDAHSAANDRLVGAHELGGRIEIPAAGASNQLVKLAAFGQDIVLPARAPPSLITQS